MFEMLDQPYPSRQFDNAIRFLAEYYDHYHSHLPDLDVGMIAGVSLFKVGQFSTQVLDEGEIRKLNDKITQRLRDYTYNGKKLPTSLQRWLAEIDGALPLRFLYEGNHRDRVFSLNDIARATKVRDERRLRAYLNKLEKLEILSGRMFLGSLKLYGFAHQEEPKITKLIDIVNDVIKVHLARISIPLNHS